MSNPGNELSALAQGVEKWGLAHWTYIVVAVGFNLLGVFFRI